MQKKKKKKAMQLQYNKKAKEMQYLTKKQIIRPNLWEGEIMVTNQKNRQYVT
jgi:hypothetical protein